MQVGLRTTNDQNPGFNIIDGREANRLSAEEIGKRIKATVGNNPVYLTFDIDCLDPAYAPGTGTPVCGGLTSSHALNILWELRGINIIGMDVVEVNPGYDHADITALAAATIALELVCLYAYRNDKTPAK
jgi:agmatinase